MPCKKHTVKYRIKNLKGTRNAKVQSSHTSTFLENKDKLIIPTNRPLEHAVGECGGSQEDEEMVIDKSSYGLEIVEQLALDDFNAILQKAQRLAGEAGENPKKCPRKYTGKSERKLKRCRSDLAKQGYLSVFEHMAHVENTSNKSVHMKQLITNAVVMA
ncbi:hypothetical protein BJV74DRAFT_795644 [Russula compacta]|nr:hypothetical protein BJV74DRAFT_795644 [Russula compacta]